MTKGPGRRDVWPLRCRQPGERLDSAMENTGPHADLTPLAIRLMWDVDGVVDVIDRLSAAPAPGAAG